MDGLLKRRSVIKGQITKLTTYAKSCLDTTPYDEMQTRLEKLKEHYTNFVGIEDEIFAIDAEQKSDIDAIDDNYYLCVATLQRLMRTKIQTPPRNLNDTILNSSVTVPSSDFKLPRLTLPTFSGKAREWQSFYDLFKSTIHENTNLSPAQKFQYLIGQLRGPAETLVRHFSVDDASYIEAFQKLIKRYDRKRSIVNEFIEAFVKQPPITKPSIETVGRIYDCCDEVIRGLKAIGPSAELRDCWLVYLTERKLDDVTLQLWRQESSELDFPKIEQLLEFLNKRMNSLEGIKVQASKVQLYQNVTPRSLFAEPKPLPKCSLCVDQLHRLCDCPKFIEMSSNQRRQYVNKSARCFNCLAEGHSAFQCRSKGRCHQCNKKHHSLTHADQNDPNVSSELKQSKSTSATTALCKILEPVDDHLVTSPHTLLECNADALLPTAMVEICDKLGNWQPCRALLDSASTRSYITEKCANRLSVRRSNARFNINTLNGGKASSSRGMTSITIRSRNNTEFTMGVTAYVISKITSNLPPTPINRDELTYLHCLPLADPNFHMPGSIDILIGCDRFLYLLSDGQTTMGSGQPIAQNTKLGWIVGGEYEVNDVSGKVITCLSSQEEINIDKSLRRFWEIEELPAVQQYTDEERLCIEHFDNHLKIGSSGKFIVPLPFKPNKPKLGDSLSQALRRFNSLEQRLMKNPELHKTYSKFMAEYEALGHMELIPPEEITIPNEQKYYLPHHPVMKDSSSTTKLRVVFDASAKSSNGVSLNDSLMVGPTVQNSLLEILIRFRKHRYIFTADIEKMFRQVWINKPDTNYQRIIWRNSPTSPIKHYRLLTNTYGTASASFLATQSLNKLAQLHLTTYPNAAKVMMRDFYMDDLMSGTSTLEEAISTQTELNSLCQLGGYHLRKWASNNVKLLESVPEDDREISIREITEGTKLISILGIKFDPQADSFSFSVSLPKTTRFTKRNMLSEASRVFDPMGWLSPVTIGIKILFQGLWLLKLGWDDQLPADVEKQWIAIRSKLSLLKDLKIPRWLNSDENLHLCGFADASNNAYAAVLYARTTNHLGEVVTNIISAKTKVAPIKYVTTARLELCAALLLVRMLNLVTKSLEFNQSPNVSLWSDSTTVLAWLANPPRKGNIFVLNRVTEILSSTNVQQWSYVPSKNNPADVASRGVLPDELLEDIVWWQGPVWLRQEPIQNPESAVNISYKIKSEATTNLTTKKLEKPEHNENLVIAELAERYSSVNRAVRIFAWVQRVKFNLKNLNAGVGGPLTVSEVDKSYKLFIKEAQLSSFNEEIMSLSNNIPIKKSNISFLYPFLDNAGVLRAGGRLENANEQYNVKHPIIISGSHYLARKLVEEAHIQHLHAGPNLLISIIKQQYTILRCKDLVRRVIHNCIHCARHKKILQHQLMGQLPPPRVNLIRAFLQTSVDYAGPYMLKTHRARKASTYKAYIVVFVCMATKAVHLELASDLTTDTFLAAFKRFQNRRGICTDVYSDNGTNFVGAANEIKYFQQLLSNNEQQILNWATTNNTKWHFVPPSSPHFNGLCEAAVKSAKFHLRRVLGQSIPRYEELNTLLTQIEALLNSRPLCDSLEENIQALTPAHFIIGQPITMVPEPDLTHLKVNRLSRWQMVQQMFQHFARRWQSEYLTTLNSLSKWRLKQNNIKIGDLVVLRDDNVPPGQWALGRISEIHPGRDEIVRVVTIKTSKGLLKRPITKICLLPIIDSSNSSTAATCWESSKLQ